MSVCYSERVSECCLALIEYIFSYIMARTSYIQWNEDDIRFAPDQNS
jgi:hypothetical protein